MPQRIHASGSTILAALVLILLVFVPCVETALQSNVAVSSIGRIEPSVNVALNTSKVIGVNNLSLGFMIDSELKKWLDSSVQRGLARDANFKLIRFFDFRQTNLPLMPVTYWNDSSKTGTYNWTIVDTFVQRIFEIGAEPLVCLGWAQKNPDIMEYLPPGMAINAVTGLPYPESYAAYAAEWVKHFEASGMPVRYYEIFNEPYHYFGWNRFDTTRLANYLDLWNTVSRTMRQENPSIFISFDASTIKWVLDYWLQYGDNIDYIDFHKYDSGVVGQYTDSEMFIYAEEKRFETSPLYYGVREAQQKWVEKRGKRLPIINSESNFNWAYVNGTDQRIQQMAGTVWTSLVIRTAILKGLSYNVYNSFSSSASIEQRDPSKGYGFGMVNSYNNKPWYPYYLNRIIGNSIGIGDRLIEANSSSNDIRCLAWIHKEMLNIFLILKEDQPRTVCIRGLVGVLTYQKIDDTISFLTPSIQTGIIDVANPFILKGYTVVLLQTRL